MTTEHDPVVHALGRLPSATPDASRAERVRLRCRAVLARRRAAAADPDPAGFARRVLEPAIACGLGVLYLAVVIHDALRWRGLL